MSQLGAEILIRPARSEDAASLAALATQLGYPSTPEQVEMRLDEIRRDPRQRVRVAQTADGVVVGWVHVAVGSTLESDPQAEIQGLVVEERVRGKGIGRRLMEEAEAWARDEGVPGIRLRSNVVREAAHAFYQHLGYRITKTQHTFVKEL